MAAAVAGERRRVARELHDIISHALGVMVLQADAADAPRPAALHTLTDRELEVLGQVARGLTNREIAARLTSAKAPSRRTWRILAKLGLRDRVQIVIYAYERGITRPGDSAPPSPH